MTTQKQRSRKAANEECAEDIVAKVDDADGETLLAPAIAASLEAQANPVAAFCALDGSTIALQPAVADQSAIRFKGQPPKAAPPAGHRQAGSFRFRSKWGR